MNREEMMMMREMEMNERLAQAQINSASMNQAQQSVYLDENERSLINDQLDLSEQLELIENLLRGKLKVKTDKGEVIWIPPKDKSMVVLTEYGIHLIMNTITFYINKNTLLSNYDEDTIKIKMRDFAVELIDAVFMDYDKVFQQPTTQECIDEFKARMKKKTELRKFTYELIGKTYVDGEIEKEFLREMEGRVEIELEKIREVLVKKRLKRYPLLMREIQDAVHSTYLRAWNGQERRTLRQHIHISESNSPSMMSQKSKGGLFSGFKSSK